MLSWQPSHNVVPHIDAIDLQLPNSKLYILEVKALSPLDHRVPRMWVAIIAEMSFDSGTSRAIVSRDCRVQPVPYP